MIRTHQRAVGLLLVPRENTPDGQDQEIIVQQMEQFFFGEGAALPPNFVFLRINAGLKPCSTPKNQISVTPYTTGRLDEITKRSLR